MSLRFNPNQPGVSNVAKPARNASPDSATDAAVPSKSASTAQSSHTVNALGSQALADQKRLALILNSTSSQDILSVLKSLQKPGDRISADTNAFYKAMQAEFA